MADDQLGIILGRGCAATRFGDALLRSLGRDEVTLRISDASSGDTASQLGLEAPSPEDLRVWPAAVKPLDPTPDGRPRIEVTLCASSLREAAKNYGIENISAWLLSMQGVVRGDGVLRISTVTVEKFAGKEGLYHLTASE